MLKHRLRFQILIGCILLRALSDGFTHPMLAQTMQPRSECQFLSEALLRQSLKYEGPLSQLSQVKTRCHYQWPKTDQEQRLLQNQTQLRQSMRMGANAYEPVSLYNQVQIELLQEFESLTQAQNEFNQHLKNTSSNDAFGSPDVFSELKWESVQGTKDKQWAWNKTQSYLLLQSNKRLFLLQIKIEDDPAQNQAKAYLLATQLK